MPTILGAWVFSDISSPSTQGIYFDDKGYFCRWNYDTPDKAFSIWGGYSQTGKKIQMQTDRATWPDGLSMNGTAEVASLDGGTLQLKMQDHTYKFVSRPYEPGVMFAPH